MSWRVKLSAEDLAEIITKDEQPSMRRSASTIIDLRTRLEMRTLFLQVSLAINMAFLIARLVG